ncbi:MAG: O-antigen ligase family protein [Steroidobacteraceae bacterium]
MSTVPRASVPRSIRENLTGIWTVQFFGVALFTLISVTARWPHDYPAVILALAGMFFGRERIRFPAPFWWGVALLGWGLITCVFSISWDVAFKALDIRLKVLLIFLVLLNALRSEKQLWVYLLVVLGAFMLYPARGTVLNYLHGYVTEGRAAWNYIYSNPNDDAAMTILVLGAALSVATAAVQSKAVRWGSWACVVILILALLFTKSRGGFVGFAIGIGLPLLRRTMKRPGVAFCALLAVCIGLALLPDKLWSRLEGMQYLTSTSTFREADKYGSAEQRWQIQKTAWKIAVDHPLLGVGLGCYRIANNEYRPDLGYRDAHNTYLRLAAETGFPGLLIWAGLVVSVLRHVKRGERLKSKLQSLDLRWLRYGLLGFLTAGIFGSFSELSILFLVLAIMWAGTTLMLEQNAPPAVPRPATVI